MLRSSPGRSQKPGSRGAISRGLQLGQLFGAYFRLKAPGLSDDRQKAASTRRDLFGACWGSDRVVIDISQTDVDLYSRRRRSGELAPDLHGRTMVGVRDGTIDGDFRWLSSVCNWARRHKLGGRRLLPENPLHDVDWPKEANPRRPVASHQRFTATLVHVDAVDDKGRLRAILELLRYTGRRLGAICQLTAEDVLRTSDQVRNALARSGMDERLAEHMPHGAIRWSEQTDKMGLLFVSPLSTPARAALDTYMRMSPRLGAVPLFPAPGDVSVSIGLPPSRQVDPTGGEGRGAAEAARIDSPCLQAAVGERTKAHAGRRRGRGGWLEGHPVTQVVVSAGGRGDGPPRRRAHWLTEARHSMSEDGDPIGLGKAIEKTGVPELVKLGTDLLRKVLEPAAEGFGLMGGDQVADWRRRNVDRIAARAAARLAKKGVEPQPIPSRTLFPLLEGASLESDEMLCEMWAALLARAAEEPSRISTGMVRVLRELSPSDAYLLTQTLPPSRYRAFGHRLMDYKGTRASVDLQP